MKWNQLNEKYERFYKECVFYGAAIVILFLVMTALFDYANKHNTEVESFITTFFARDHGAISEIVENEGWKKIDSEVEKANAACGWIVRNVDYSTDESDCKNGYAVIKTRKGDCVGQSHLYYLFMKELGMECHMLSMWRVPASEFESGEIKRTASNLAHAVNIVKVDGEWRYVDCTTWFGCTLPVAWLTDGIYDFDFEQGQTVLVLSEYWQERLEEESKDYKIE